MNTVAKDLALEAPGPLSDEAKSVLNAALELCDDSPIAIASGPEAEDANGELQVIKGAITRVENTRMSFTRPLDELKKRWISFFTPTLERLAAREATYKTALAGWVRKEREREEAERRKAAEAARIEQERLDREAAAKAKRLEKKGDPEAAQAVRDAVPIVVPAAPVAAAQTPKGFAVREVWKGRCTNKMTLIKAVAAGTASEELLDINDSALNKMASALKKLFQIPGCEAYIEEGTSSRRV